MRRTALALFFSLVSAVLFPVCAGGLRFTGGANEQNNTVYDVWTGRIPLFKDSFSIEFEIEIYDYHSVGQIMRISDQENLPDGDFILAYSFCDTDKSFFQLNLDKKQCYISDTLDNKALGPGHWLPVKMNFDLKGGSISLDIGGDTGYYGKANFRGVLKPEIYFGSRLYEEQFAAFSIRKVKIYDDVTVHEFPMNEFAGDEVHDINGHRRGRTEPCGEWLLNRSYGWREVFVYRSSSVASVNYNTDENSFLILNRDSLISFVPYSGRMDKIRLPEPMPMEPKLGTGRYDPADSSLWIYEVNNLPPGAVTSVELDLESLEWKNPSTDYIETQRHHHTGFRDESNGRYTIFGGFGNRRYSNEFVSYDGNSRKWSAETFYGDSITPRFAVSSARLSECRYLLYGGVGNESGDEMLGLIYYDDLYELDTYADSIVRKWSIPAKGYNMVPVRNIIVNDTTFYAMCYPIKDPDTYLKLYEISIDDGSRVQVGDSIHVHSSSILSNVNIYENRGRGELYCVVQEYKNENESSIKIYAINSPVVPADRLKEVNVQNTFIYIFIAVLIIFLPTLYISFISINRRRIKSGSPSAPDAKREDVRKNSIYVFGEFKAYDRNGRDISYMFSTRLYQLFVLVLFHTFRDEEGISSPMVAEMLWPDKDTQSVKNIKGVTFSKLRGILKEFDGADIVYEDGKYCLRLSDAFYSDWREFCRLWKNYNSGNADMLSGMSVILKRGKLFDGYEYDCLDSVKSEFDTDMMSFLPFQIEKSFAERNYKEVMDLTDVVFGIDPCNEHALKYQLMSLLKMNRKDLAQKRYIRFKMEYLKVTGEDFPVDYATVVNPLG